MVSVVSVVLGFSLFQGSTVHDKSFSLSGSKFQSFRINFQPFRMAPYSSGGGGVDRPTRPARGAVLWPARAPARDGTIIIYTFSTAVCMEWRDGHTTHSKDARMVIEPVCF